MGKYFEVPAAELLGLLKSIGDAVVTRGGRYERTTFGKEIVVLLALPPPRGKTEIRIFTSVSQGADVARECGADAIRILWGYRAHNGSEVSPGGGFKPLAEATRVFRTAPAGSPDRRLAAFLERLRLTVRSVYAEAVKAHSCPQCGAPLVVRKSARNAFRGCAAFPGCRFTAPLAGEPPAAPKGLPEPKPEGGSRVAQTLIRAERDRLRPELVVPRSMPGHRAVAAFGLPRGGMARAQVEDGLADELDGATFFDVESLKRFP